MKLSPRSSSRLDHSRQRELEIVSLGHRTIVTHPRSKTGVPWCQSPIISETTPNSSHQRLKLTRRATPATLLASPLLRPPPSSSFLVVDILSAELGARVIAGALQLFFGRLTHNFFVADCTPIHKGPFMTKSGHCPAVHRTWSQV